MKAQAHAIATAGVRGSRSPEAVKARLDSWRELFAEFHQTGGGRKEFAAFAKQHKVAWSTAKYWHKRIYGHENFSKAAAYQGIEDAVKQFNGAPRPRLERRSFPCPTCQRPLHERELVRLLQARGVDLGKLLFGKDD